MEIRTNFSYKSIDVFIKFLRMESAQSTAHLHSLIGVSLITITFQIAKNQSCRMMPKYFVEHFQKMAIIL